MSRTYDTNYRVTAVVSPALELRFTLDYMGNIKAVTETGGASATYLYDPLYRLTSVNDATGKAIETYTYNPTGDRLSKTAPGAYTGAYKYQAGTHWLTATGTASRTYDANGNTTGNAAAGTVWGYGYNGRNRMTVVQQGGSTVGTYVYNANNERIAKTANKVTTRFVYDEASQLVSEASGTTRRDYVAIGGLPVAVVDGGTATTIGFVTADGLGSPRAVTSTAGAVIWNWPYSLNPFGENRAVSASGYVLNLRLPGQYADGEAGLKYNMHRSFDAATGRYLQSDPMGLQAGTNTYIYALANPLLHWDASGLCPGEACDPSGSAPTPQQYEQLGRASNDAIYTYNPYSPGSLGTPGGAAYNFATLYHFKRGDRLDAQVQYGGSTAYANYVYGVYLSAAGWSLSETLSSANAYGRPRSKYGPDIEMSTDYPDIPTSNVNNITRGYWNQQEGNLCHAR